MRYLGNKTRLAKKLAPILLSTQAETYIEPFCGAAGMLSNIDHPNRIGYDICPYIIELLRAVRDGYVPTPITKEEYEEARQFVKTYDLSDKATTAYLGFVGYGCSFGGKFFAGYAQDGTNKRVPRDHSEESIRNLLKLRPKIQCTLEVKDYKDIQTSNSIIYCDIPYQNTTKYKTSFDHTTFWNWARKMSKTNTLYVSEYTAPKDFTCIWSKQHKTGIDAKLHKPTVEKLFQYSNDSAIILN